MARCGAGRPGSVNAGGGQAHGDSRLGVSVRRVVARHASLNHVVSEWGAATIRAREPVRSIPAEIGLVAVRGRAVRVARLGP